MNSALRDIEIIPLVPPRRKLLEDPCTDFEISHIHCVDGELNYIDFGCFHPACFAASELLSRLPNTKVSDVVSAIINLRNLQSLDTHFSHTRMLVPESRPMDRLDILPASFVKILTIFGLLNGLATNNQGYLFHRCGLKCLLRHMLKIVLL